MDPRRGHASNNFDALRIVAALMVVFGHAYVLSGHAAEEPLVRFTGVGGFGELGVSIFFVVSGFLVTASYMRVGRTAPYLANRCLRILPGLAVALVLTAWVLGPLVTSLATADYFARVQTWTYVARDLLLYPVTYALPGVFETNPYPGAVNGSLWTLRLEFSLYLLLPVLAWLRLMSPRMLALAAAAGLLAYWASLALGPERTPAFAVIALRNGYLFMAGAALFAWRERLPLSDIRLTFALLAVFAASLPFKPVAPVLAVAVLPALVASFALHPLPGLRSASRLGDFSYGVYIYAFPVQQALMHWIGPERLSVPAFFGLALACVIPLAAASWWLVERPALGLKGVAAARLAGRGSARIATAQAGT